MLLNITKKKWIITNQLVKDILNIENKNDLVSDELTSNDEERYEYLDEILYEYIIKNKDKFVN